jgi:hypothetical protein
MALTELDAQMYGWWLQEPHIEQSRAIHLLKKVALQPVCTYIKNVLCHSIVF